MYTDLLLWIVLWFGIFGFSNQVLRKRGYTYTNRFGVTIVFFVLSNILVYFLFKDYFLSFFTLGSKYIYISILFFGATSLIYWLLQNFTEYHRGIGGYEYTYIKHSFLLSKGFEILFQDLLLVSLLYIFRTSFANDIQFILLFGLFFGLVHLPLAIFKQDRGAWFIVGVSFGLGLVLPLVYLISHFDFIYLYGTHWIFYIVGGIGYRTISVFRKFLNNRK